MCLNGKEKCEQLKEIRKRIADVNGIPYEPMPCTHEGDCRGTCPACDSEVDYLERELEKKRIKGEIVILKGITEDMFQEALQSEDSFYDNSGGATMGIFDSDDFDSDDDDWGWD